MAVVANTAIVLALLASCVPCSVAKNGFILTVPDTLRYGTTSEFCLTIFDDVSPRAANISLLSADEGETKVRVEDIYFSGIQKCKPFVVPEPGDYELLLTNQTDILHDVIEVSVVKDKPITLVQTDKPMYKPGQSVKFRIMTLLTDLKPRIGKINSVYIKDPNQIRVKQFLNVETKGLASLKFQLNSEAKLGTWHIEVNMVNQAEGNAEVISADFVVKEYVLPRFEVTINPPSYILADAELIKGSVCGKYTYGKPVQGFLDLNLCWGYEWGRSNDPCVREVVELKGCHNFTVNTTELLEGSYYLSGEFQVRASVTEGGTGAVVNKTHSGPRMTNEPLKVEVEDYTNGFFKPRLPYVGKVTVKKPDGSPAAGEIIQIVANDYENRQRYSGNFSTDAQGVITYSLCETFTENTTSISISAEAIMYKEEDNMRWSPRNMRMPSGYKSIKQWFSPSYSYIQIPRSDSSLRCGERFTHGVPFTTRDGRTTKFTYQVMARGNIVQRGHVEAGSSVKQTLKPAQKTCLKAEVKTTLPTKPTLPTLPTAVLEPKTLPTDIPPPPIIEIDVPEIYYDEDRELEEIDEEVEIEETIENVEPLLPPPEYFPPIDIGEFKEPILRPLLLSDHVSSFLLDMEITTDMAPRFTLLVFHIMEDGEVVADSMEFMVEPCFGNKVEMTFNKTSVLPGEKVDISVHAAPGSVCGVGVVDRSINIIGGDHQVTQETVFKRLEDLSWSGFQSNPWDFYESDNDYCENRIKKILVDDDSSDQEMTYHHYTSSFVDALQAFKSSGFRVITNLNLQTRPCQRAQPMIYYYDLENMGPVPAVALNGEVGVPTMVGRGMMQPTKAPRTNFPETWLWDIVLVGEDGKSVETHTAPDVITSWVGNAMCVDQNKGFGVSAMTSLVTFQPFFLSLHLPYSAVRGERLSVIFTVYNYLDKCLHIQITLDAEDNAFEVNNQGQRRPFCVCGGKSYSAKMHVTPQTIGSLPLNAKAEVVPGLCSNDVDTETGYEGYSDAVRRHMLVKAEGVMQEYTSTSYICNKLGGSATNDEVILPLPEDMVKDSAIGEVRVIGDIMGPALTNLDNLVRMPTGCGEQNMVGFVPNILVLQYLRQSHRLTEEVEDQCLEYMEIGYQRELNYRHPDGSFSAFGPSSDGQGGSVWLTAFVVKSFAQARPYMYIDEADMSLSLSFLRRSQLEQGCFRETGKVFSSYMMGGLAKGKRKEVAAETALTAYVLIALLKADTNKTERVIVDALECINRNFQVEKSKMDPYTLSLVAYANTLYMPQSHVSSQVMKVLGGKAKKEGSLRYWQRDSKAPPAKVTWYYRAAPSAEVEMTSYALLAYMNFYGTNAVAQTHDIAMWISQQRNPRGGFASTQDTVLGLSALAEFASLSYSSQPQELRVHIGGKGMDATHNVSESLRTSLLLHTTRIPSLPGQVSIETEGVGCALVQAHVQFNKMPAALQGDDKPAFYLRVKPRLYVHDIDQCDKRTLDIFVGARGPQKFSTGMAIVELKMVTGWTPMQESLITMKSLFPILGIKRHEYKDDEGVLIFYFDEMNRKQKRFSIHLEQDKDLKVSSPKPAEIRVYQYYETDVTLSKSYSLKTICGTKNEIPRNPEWTANQPDWVQRRIDGPIPNIGRVMGVMDSSSTSSNCPLCPSTKIVPKDLMQYVCNATAVYKAIAGRSGAKPIKLRQNLRPIQVVGKINKFANFELPEGCQCSLLKPKTKRVVMFVKEELPGRVLRLDATSAVILANKKLEKEVRQMQKKCPQEE